MIPLKFKRTYPLLFSLMMLGCTKSNAPSHDNVTIYSAETIITIDDKQPEAKAVAINDSGKIIGLGDLKDLKVKFNGAKIDDQFKNKTIVPGLIDPHVHMTCLLYTSPSPRDQRGSRMPSSA